MALYKAAACHLRISSPGVTRKLPCMTLGRKCHVPVAASQRARLGMLGYQWKQEGGKDQLD